MISKHFIFFIYLFLTISLTYGSRLFLKERKDEEKGAIINPNTRDKFSSLPIDLLDYILLYVQHPYKLRQVNREFLKNIPSVQQFLSKIYKSDRFLGLKASSEFYYLLDHSDLNFIVKDSLRHVPISASAIALATIDQSNHENEDSTFINRNLFKFIVHNVDAKALALFTCHNRISDFTTGQEESRIDIQFWQSTIFELKSLSYDLLSSALLQNYDSAVASHIVAAILLKSDLNSEVDVTDPIIQLFLKYFKPVKRELFFGFLEAISFYPEKVGIDNSEHSAVYENILLIMEGLCAECFTLEEVQILIKLIEVRYFENSESIELKREVRSILDTETSTSGKYNISKTNANNNVNEYRKGNDLNLSFKWQGYFLLTAIYQRNPRLIRFFSLFNPSESFFELKDLIRKELAKESYLIQHLSDDTLHRLFPHIADTTLAPLNIYNSLKVYFSDVNQLQSIFDNPYLHSLHEDEFLLVSEGCPFSVIEWILFNPNFRLPFRYMIIVKTGDFLTLLRDESRKYPRDLLMKLMEKIFIDFSTTIETFTANDWKLLFSLTKLIPNFGSYSDYSDNIAVERIFNNPCFYPQNGRTFSEIVSWLAPHFGYFFKALESYYSSEKFIEFYKFWELNK